MTLFDYTVLLIIGLSVIISLMRGAVREFIALLGWVLAAGLAIHYGSQVAVYLPASIPDQNLRLLAAMIGIFGATWLVTTLLAIAISELVKALGLGVIDRMLGLVFGLIRGMVVVLAIVIAAGLTSMPQEPYWKSAMFSPPLEALALSIKPWLPADLAARMKFD